MGRRKRKKRVRGKWVGGKGREKTEVGGRKKRKRRVRGKRVGGKGREGSEVSE